MIRALFKERGDTRPRNSMQNTATTAAEGLSVSDFLKIIRNRKAVILSILFLCLISTAMATALIMKKWYLATAAIRVEKPEGEVALFQHRISSAFDPYFIKEQFEIIQSKKILMRVIENLALRKRLAKPMGYPPGLLPPAEEVYKFLVGAMLNVESRPGTALIDIGVEAMEDAGLAAQIANEIARVYEKDRIEFATSAQTEGIAKLKEELREQEKIASAQRDTVEKLRQELQISGVDINTEAIQLEIEQLRQMEHNLTALKVDTIARQTRWERFREIPRQERISLVNSEMIPDSNIQNLLQAYMMRQQEYIRLKNRLGEEHPDFIAARESIEVTKNQLLQLLDGYEKSLEIAFLESKARVSELEKHLGEARLEQIESASSKMRKFDEAIEKLKDDENMLKAMRITLRQREIDFQVPKRTIEILSQAEPPEKYHRPNWILNISLAFIFGGVLAVGCAYLVEFLDTSFRSVEDMERKLQLPILGVVSKRETLVSTGNIDSFETEPYRVIHTNLGLAAGEERGNLLVVQSAGPGEGKSTTLYNLAVVMALSGSKVLVLDTDLRRPVQHKLLDLSRSPGMIECLQGKAGLSGVIQETPVKNLHIITSGAGHNFALNILYGKQLGGQLEELSRSYDRILMDSPPIIGISDASVLASLADGVIFVIQHRRNPQSMNLRAKQIIENVGGRILGVVLNKVPESGGEDYNYYTSNYYYYSHHKDPPPKKGNAGGSAAGDETEQFDFEEIGSEKS